MIQVLFMLCLLPLSLLVGLYLRTRPRLLVGIAVSVMFLVPVWFGFQLAFHWRPQVLASALIIFCLIGSAKYRWNAADSVVAIVGFLILISQLLGFVFWQTMTVTLSQWVLPFFAARIAGQIVGQQFMTDLITVLILFAAVLIVIEFATGWNPFLLLEWSGLDWDIWGSSQHRGGFDRAEGPFGHSIAAGAVLGICVPLIFTSRFAVWVRTLGLAVIVVATFGTFSRIALAVVGLSLVCSLVFLRAQLPAKIRRAGLAACGLGAVFLVPLSLAVFDTASDEVYSSTAFRANMFSLFREANLLGFSDVAAFDTRGALRFGGLLSIDSAALWSALSIGWILTLALASLWFGALTKLRSPNVTPFIVAIVASLPALMFVMFITQYMDIFWFIAGLAATGFASETVESRSRVLQCVSLTCGVRNPLEVNGGIAA